MLLLVTFLVSAESEMLLVKVWVILPVPAGIIIFLLAAMVVVPLRETDPVLVLNAPEEALKSKALAPPIAVILFPLARLTFPRRVFVPEEVSKVPLPLNAKVGLVVPTPMLLQ